MSELRAQIAGILSSNGVTVSDRTSRNHYAVARDYSDQILRLVVEAVPDEDEMYGILLKAWRNAHVSVPVKGVTGGILKGKREYFALMKPVARELQAAMVARLKEE